MIILLQKHSITEGSTNLHGYLLRRPDRCPFAGLSSSLFRRPSCRHGCLLRRDPSATKTRYCPYEGQISSLSSLLQTALKLHSIAIWFRLYDKFVIILGKMKFISFNLSGVNFHCNTIMNSEIWNVALTDSVIIVVNKTVVIIVSMRLLLGLLRFVGRGITGSVSSSSRRWTRSF